jgi:hypothetical protein
MHRLRYIDMNDLGYRNVWVSLAITIPIGAVGLFLLRNDPQAKGFLVLIGLFCSILLRHALDNRELRKREED